MVIIDSVSRECTAYIIVRIVHTNTVPVHDIINAKAGMSSVSNGLFWSCSHLYTIIIASGINLMYLNKSGTSRHIASL